ncbi:MAG: DNA-directed RNA polymerase subunit alpha [Candidatus Wildermuthbacteria bacterium RIFCSPHIGHO2_02_FULL_47_12]|uniref:DNA-directed RNA polymerase subunit alpha n=2 Tax=Parcubacteria group TaxID=1794811 RepID=A0A1G2R6S0_9BACT|nr:MAG: DNA-directed RNA polymerase subunit alpha [Candidatus Buchananbacteria bacterium RIFCSPLOWO2_01_FULL_46_12]OHA67781.1 MAG: DNA-directed RNA polymerase subunit alpha [Candidatus Wildermuthbacteria bacterium RIFCSPHIGHO2_02_FULL_47_12]
MIPFPKPIVIKEEKGNKGVFEIEELYPGYGATIGNSLRRVLLSSLEGAAVTQAKIKGVSHEFSTIPGIAEDVITIILNLKQMRFKMYGTEPQTATIKVKGEKEIRGSDFKLSSQLELINTDIVIAHRTEKSGEFEMELQIERGIGYVPVSEQKKEKNEIGTLALDGIFTPVQNVSFRVEHMRVGEKTDFDRVIMEIETDGTMRPALAVQTAIEILQKHFERIGEGLKDIKEEEPKPVPAKAAADKAEKKPAKKKGSKKK